ncbi:MAG: hypothetical protein AUH86_18265 [Acidobacteria bacterium 13_1_40CM_4_58_4]|nr:MAG: hypothetical protein AUH86_18265 [Acidobacteria bacterium 13_1_40CM_4_58_4]
MGLPTFRFVTVARVIWFVPWGQVDTHQFVRFCGLPLQLLSAEPMTIPLVGTKMVWSAPAPRNVTFVAPLKEILPVALL